MTLEEARKVFEQYDGILLEMWQKDHDAYSRFQDAYIFSEITEQWRRELIEKAYTIYRAKGYEKDLNARQSLKEFYEAQIEESFFHYYFYLQGLQNPIYKCPKIPKRYY